MSSESFGNYNLGMDILNYDFELNDGRDELFETLDANFLEFLASDHVKEDVGMKEELVKDEEGEINTTRFRKVDDSEMNRLEGSHQSKRTKQNTKWAMKIFQDWHMTTYSNPLDTSSVSSEDLCNTLRRFYCEAAPQDSDKRDRKLGNCSKVYHKNTMKNIRAAINRHLSDIGRNIDIVHDKEFNSANNTLDGCLKEQTRRGMSRPTQHKVIIDDDDLKKIAEYFRKSQFSPIVLRQGVWLNLGLHFVSRGLEFHKQLKRDSFNFHTDSDGCQYVTLNHETQQKNFQGGLSSDEAPSDRRMYATGLENCPVMMLKLMIAKTDKSAEHLFNKCNKDALVSPVTSDIWFSNSSLAERTYTNFMADICKASATTGWYTAHCVRATGITQLNNSGFEARHIMHMSGHRSEASLRSYCKEPSTGQKKNLSHTLSKLTEVNVKCETESKAPVTMGDKQETTDHPAATPIADEENKENLPASLLNPIFST